MMMPLWLIISGAPLHSAQHSSSPFVPFHFPFGRQSPTISKKKKTKKKTKKKKKQSCFGFSIVGAALTRMFLRWYDSYNPPAPSGSVINFSLSLRHSIDIQSPAIKREREREKDKRNDRKFENLMGSCRPAPAEAIEADKGVALIRTVGKCGEYFCGRGNRWRDN